MLLVDDELSFVKTVGKQLELAGFEVLIGANGEAALAMARAAQPDLVVLDLMMPKRSGLEVCAALRTDEQCKCIPIILYSGKDEEDVLTRFSRDQELLRKWGANAFVSKAEGTAALIQQIRRLLGGSTSEGD